MGALLDSLVPENGASLNQRIRRPGASGPQLCEDPPRKESALENKLWTFLEGMPAREFEHALRAAEDAGLRGVWIPQLFGPPFPAMAAAAMASTRLTIGSGVALAFTRSPLETALAALEIDVLSGGRTVSASAPACGC